MKTLLVWYLVTWGYSSNANLVWSPPMTTAEECQRVSDIVGKQAYGRQCIQMQVMK